eukprot:gene25309-30562_t
MLGKSGKQFFETEQEQGDVAVPLLYVTAGACGSHPSIQTAIPDCIEIKYKAQFGNFWFKCCFRYDECLADQTRKYFHIHENGYEISRPRVCTFCCIDPTASSTKFFFDQGIFYQPQCPLCIQGKPYLQPNNLHYVCCFQHCPDSVNSLLDCYCTPICGDRVRYVPAEILCGLCNTRADNCNTCHGFCGVANDEPWPCCLCPVVEGLVNGTAPSFIQEMDRAREMWEFRKIGIRGQ